MRNTLSRGYQQGENGTPRIKEGRPAILTRLCGDADHAAPHHSMVAAVRCLMPMFHTNGYIRCRYFSAHQKRANNLQEVIEQLSANKADRRELLELKQFMVSLNVSLPATELLRAKSLPEPISTRS